MRRLATNREKRYFATWVIAVALLVVVVGAPASAVPGPPTIDSPPDGSLLRFNLITVEGMAEPFSRVVVTDQNGRALETEANGWGAWQLGHEFRDGAYSVTATAIDRLGHAGPPSSAVDFTVDTTAPRAPVITVPLTGTATRSTSIVVAGTAETGATVKVFEGSTVVLTAVASDGRWTGTVEFGLGAHTISARATDGAGYTSPASAAVSFTVDRTPPPAPVFSTPKADAIVATPVFIAGRAEPFALVELRTSTTHWTRQTDGSGEFSFILDLGGGLYSFKARAIDRAGNVGAESPWLRFTADADAPQIVLDTPSRMVLLPGSPTRVAGRAADDAGVASVRLDYYDAIGRLVHRQTATCGQCPEGTLVGWFVDLETPLGVSEIYAYATDRVGRSSGAARITVMSVQRQESG